MAAYVWKKRIPQRKERGILIFKKGREMEERKVDFLQQIEFLEADTNTQKTDFGKIRG